jgi:hypothetical protein
MPATSDRILVAAITGGSNVDCVDASYYTNYSDWTLILAAARDNLLTCFYRDVTGSLRTELTIEWINRSRNQAIRTPQLAWLEDERMHTTNGVLSVGVSYFGTYTPAAYGRATGRCETLPGREYSCAHCAYLAAKELLVASGAPDTWVPFIKCHGPGTDMEDRAYVSMPVSDDGMISFTTNTTKMVFAESGCRHCGCPGHTIRTCSTTRRAYDMVGIEIEGRFLACSQVMRDVEEYGARHTGDGSIRYGENPNCEPMEIQTKPGTLAEALRQLARWYPDESDTSCGMHVHVSFQDHADISLLTHPEFMKYFTARWEAWGARMGLSEHSNFFKRLRGDNDFCEPNSESDLRNPWRADRYRQLNFLAWDEHKTVECRLLPMFQNARYGLAAVTELLSIYEDWLGGEYVNATPAVEVPLPQAAWELTPTVLSMSVDFDYSAEQWVESAALDIPELPPVAPDYTRVAITPRQLDLLVGSIPRAA